MLIGGPGTGKTHLVTAMGVTPFSVFPQPSIQNKRGQDKPATEYTYPQLLTENSVTRPGSIWDRQRWVNIQAVLTADNQIDDAVVQAKKDFAQQIAVASGMEYRILKSSDADKRHFRVLL